MAAMQTTDYYAFGVPIYAGLMVAEWGVARRRGQPTLSFSDSVSNVGAGMGAIAVVLALGPVFLGLYHWAPRNLALVHWEPGSWVRWALALVLAQLVHYPHHRLVHPVAARWVILGVHHTP